MSATAPGPSHINHPDSLQHQKRVVVGSVQFSLGDGPDSTNFTNKIWPKFDVWKN
jgi:hypothetical protein